MSVGAGCRVAIDGSNDQAFLSDLQDGDSLTIKPFHDQPDAQRKLEYRDRKGAQPSQGAMLPDETEQHGNLPSDQYWCSHDSDNAMASWHKARLVQQTGLLARRDLGRTARGGPEIAERGSNRTGCIHWNGRSIKGAGHMERTGGKRPRAGRAATLRQIATLISAADELQRALTRYKRGLTRLAALIEDNAKVPDALKALEARGGGGGRPRELPQAMARFEAARNSLRVSAVALATNQGMSSSALARRLGVSRQLISRIVTSVDEGAGPGPERNGAARPTRLSRPR